MIHSGFQAEKKYNHIVSQTATTGAHSAPYQKHNEPGLATIYGSHPAVKDDDGKHTYVFNHNPLKKHGYYAAVTFPDGATRDEVHQAIVDQNPHLDGTGHAANFTSTIAGIHKKYGKPLN